MKDDKASRVVEGVQMGPNLGGHHKQVEWERVDKSKPFGFGKGGGDGTRWLSTTRKPTSREAACGTATSISSTLLPGLKPYSAPSKLSTLISTHRFMFVNQLRVAATLTSSHSAGLS